MAKPNAIDVTVRTVTEQADVDRIFRNHPPANADVAAQLDAVTETMVATAHRVLELAPSSRERSLAMTHLEQCSMWTKAAIARSDANLTPSTTGDDDAAVDG